MKKITLNNIDEEILYEKSSSGLDIFMLPNKKVKSFYITLNVKFGSLITSFKEKKAKKFINVPNGIAHFIEHMKFYQPNGVTAHEYYNKLGSSINAATSYRYTFYEVYATSEFKKNLDYLLEYVYTPCFKNADIKTEKGIIKEEIKMGIDNPSTMLYMTTNELLYQKDNMKYSIAGDVEDINKINSKMLQEVYDHFYKPDNMFLVITGNFNPELAVAMVNEKMKTLNFSNIGEVEIKKIKEPSTVSLDEKIFNMDVTFPKLKLSYKMPYKNFSKLNLTNPELSAYINIILKNKFGITSSFYQKLNEEQLLSSGLYYSCLIRKEKDYIIISIETETKYPDDIRKKIIANLKNLKVDEKILERSKKILISNAVLRTDSIQVMNASIQNDIVMFDEIMQDEYQMYKNLNMTTLNKVLKCLNFSKKVYVQINPIGNQD